MHRPELRHPRLARLLPALFLLAACEREPTGVESVTTLRVVPEASTLHFDETLRLEVVGLNRRGAGVADLHVAWSTSDPALVSVDEQGYVRALAPDTAQVRTVTVTAALPTGVTGSAAIALQPIRVAEVRVRPDTVKLYAGEQIRLEAVALDHRGVELPRRLGWWSPTSQVARVDSTGLVTAVGPLFATSNTPTAAEIHVGTDGVVRRAVVWVYAAPTHVQVRVSQRLATGRVAPVTVEAFAWLVDGSFPLQDPPWHRLTSSNPAVLEVSEDHRSVRGMAPGSALLIGEAGGRADTVEVVIGGGFYDVRPLTAVGAAFGVALDLNDRGQVVGNVWSTAGDTVGILWEHGSERRRWTRSFPRSSALINVEGRTVLDPHPLLAPEHVTVINALGDVGGLRNGAVVVTRNGALHTLPPPVDSYAGASLPQPPVGFNAAGELVGTAVLLSPFCQNLAAHWRAGSPQILNCTFGENVATAINEAGALTHYFGGSSTRGFRAPSARLRLPGGQMIRIRDIGPTPGWPDRTHPRDLNEALAVVGIARSPTGALTGFLWENGRTADLSLLVPEDWVILEANGINATGAIAARARNTRTGFEGAVLLTPTF